MTGNAMDEEEEPTSEAASNEARNGEDDLSSTDAESSPKPKCADFDAYGGKLDAMPVKKRRVGSENERKAAETMGLEVEEEEEEEEMVSDNAKRAHEESCVKRNRAGEEVGRVDVRFEEANGGMDVEGEKMKKVLRSIEEHKYAEDGDCMDCLELFGVVKEKKWLMNGLRVEEDVLEVMRRNAANGNVQCCCCAALTAMAVCSENLSDMIVCEGGSQVLETMEKHLANLRVVIRASATIRAISDHKETCVRLVKLGAGSRVLEAMDTHKEIEQVQYFSFLILTNLCSDETNTGTLRTMGLDKRVFDAMERFPMSARLQSSGFKTISSLASDNSDIKFLDAFLVQSALVNHASNPLVIFHALSALLNHNRNLIEWITSGLYKNVLCAMAQHGEDLNVQTVSCSFLSCLCANQDLMQALFEFDVIRCVLATMKAFPAIPSLQIDAMTVLLRLVKSEETRRRFVTRALVGQIVESLNSNRDSSGLHEVGLKVLAELASVDAGRKYLLMELGAGLVILDSMEQHKTNEDIVVSALGVLSKLAVNAQHQKAFSLMMARKRVSQVSEIYLDSSIVRDAASSFLGHLLEFRNEPSGFSSSPRYDNQNPPSCISSSSQLNFNRSSSTMVTPSLLQTNSTLRRAVSSPAFNTDATISNSEPLTSQNRIWSAPGNAPVPQRHHQTISQANHVVNTQSHDVRYTATNQSTTVSSNWLTSPIGRQGQQQESPTNFHQQQNNHFQPTPSAQYGQTYSENVRQSQVPSTSHEPEPNYGGTFYNRSQSDLGACHRPPSNHGKIFPKRSQSDLVHGSSGDTQPIISQNALARLDGRCVFAAKMLEGVMLFKKDSKRAYYAITTLEKVLQAAPDSISLPQNATLLEQSVQKAVNADKVLRESKNIGAAFVDLNIGGVVLQLMRHHAEVALIQLHGLNFLGDLLSLCPVRPESTVYIVPRVMEAMSIFGTDQGVQVAGCRVFFFLAHLDEIRMSMMDAKVPSLIVKGMAKHETSWELQRAACETLYRLAESAEARAQLRKLQVGPLLLRAKENHQHKQDVVGIISNLYFRLSNA